MNPNDRTCLISHRLHLYLLLIACWLFLQRPAAAQEVAIPDWRFGVIEAHDAPDEANELGAGWTRVTFHWADVQAGGPETWTPQLSDAQLEAEIASGRLVVGLLIGIPAWARADDGLPKGLWRADDDPHNLWARFVQEAVGRYQGRIEHWVIWNEPDIWDTAAPGHTWEGTVGDFAQLQKVAYRVAKAANPASIIHLSAFTYYWDANYGREQYFARLLDVLAADPQAPRYNHYFDVATAHLYFQPAFIYDILQEYRQIASARGLQKPFWLVETNAPPMNDPTWPVANVTLEVTMNEQAAFIPQAIALALAAGAERIAIYKLKDVPADVSANPEPFGLLRMDGSRRPAFTTYRQAIRYFAGVHQAARERWDAVAQIELDQGDFTTTILFSRLPTAQEAMVMARSEQAILADMWGTQQVLRATDGRYRVALPPAYCSQSIGDYCMIGSTAYYLIQAKEGKQLLASVPAPAWSPTHPPPPTVVPPAAPTPTPSPTAHPTLTPSRATVIALLTTTAPSAVSAADSVTPEFVTYAAPSPSPSPASELNFSPLRSGYWIALATILATLAVAASFRRK